METRQTKLTLTNGGPTIALEDPVEFLGALRPRDQASDAVRVVRVQRLAAAEQPGAAASVPGHEGETRP